MLNVILVYDIQKWMTRIIQNWMIDYDIQKWMTGIIQNWMIIVYRKNHPKWMITDGQQSSNLESDHIPV